jgi:hypothetical protein
MTIEVEGGDRTVRAGMPQANDGYEIPKVFGDLDEIAMSQGMTPLSRFVQEDGDVLEEIASAMEEMDMEVPEYDTPDPDAWHDPAEALSVLKSILSHLRAHPEWIEERWAGNRRIAEDEIVPELEGFAQRLAYLASRQVRFRFDVG